MISINRILRIEFSILVNSSFPRLVSDRSRIALNTLGTAPISNPSPRRETGAWFHHVCSLPRFTSACWYFLHFYLYLLVLHFRKYSLRQGLLCFQKYVRLMTSGWKAPSKEKYQSRTSTEVFLLQSDIIYLGWNTTCVSFYTLESKTKAQTCTLNSYQEENPYCASDKFL